MAQLPCAYHVYRVHAAYLNDWIKRKNLEIVPELYSKGILTDEQKCAVTDESTDEKERIKLLIKIVETKVRESDDNFYDILDAFSSINIDVQGIQAEFENDLEKRSQASSRKSSLSDSQSSVFFSSTNSQQSIGLGIQPIKRSQGSTGSDTGSSDLNRGSTAKLSKSKSMDFIKTHQKDAPQRKKSFSESGGAKPTGSDNQTLSPYTKAIASGRRGSTGSNPSLKTYTQQGSRRGSSPTISPPSFPLGLLPEEPTGKLLESPDLTNTQVIDTREPSLSLESCQATYDPPIPSQETLQNTTCELVDQSESKGPVTQETSSSKWKLQNDPGDLNTDFDEETQIDDLYETLEGIAIGGVRSSLRRFKRDFKEKSKNVQKQLEKQLIELKDEHDIVVDDLQRKSHETLKLEDQLRLQQQETAAQLEHESHIQEQLKGKLAEKESEVQDLKAKLINASREVETIRQDLDNSQQRKGIKKKIMVLKEVDELLKPLDNLGSNPDVDAQEEQELKSSISKQLNRIYPRGRPATTGYFCRGFSRQAL